MKISIVSPDAIRRHQANTSSSKYSFGFSRQHRFKPSNPEYIYPQLRCKVHVYCKDQSKLSKIKYSVGQGKRSDFTQTLTSSPPSTKYSHKSIFEKDHRKGKTFGLSREGSPDRSYLKPQIWKHPAPNQVNCIKLSMSLLKN